ncbi:MAG: HAD-IA family hydrolase [Clostridia bacterium]|nr:HAD-IA family hydrolase [Clostridia bacterium]
MNENRKIKAVLFDFDGTLMNTNDIIFRSWYHTYDTIGMTAPDDTEIAWTFGEPLRETMARIFPDRDAQEMVAIYRSYQNEIFKGTVNMFPRVDRMVMDLKAAGFRTAIVTSRLWSLLTPAVYNFSISDEFDTIVSASDTKAHKPDPTCLFLACEKLGISPEEAIYVGDSRFDIHCAKNAGMKSVLVGWTVCLPPEKRSGLYLPDFVISEPEELIDIVCNIN